VPISHGIASIRAQEMAYGIKPSHNGRLLQNLILGGNFIQSHILHFYHLAALDFVDVTAVLGYKGRDRVLRSIKQWVESCVASNDIFPAAPLLPRFEGNYIESAEINLTLLANFARALDIRQMAHAMTAVFAAKMPHSTSLIPGGCTQAPTVDGILQYRTRLREIYDFAANEYLADVVSAAQAYPELWEVGRGPADMLAYGAFELEDDSLFFPRGTVIGGKFEAFDPGHIAEHVTHSWFADGSARHPYSGKTVPAPGKQGAYSWLKAPRYQNRPMEVGPAARVMVGYHNPRTPWIKQEVDKVIKPLGLRPEVLASVLGRHLSRALETIWLCKQCNQWLDELEPGKHPAEKFKVPDSGQGFGLTEAPRGALGHWLTLKGHAIDNYQCIVPTTWNCSPRDDEGKPGTVEIALEGLAIQNPEQPLEIGRVVRSFDPCLSCAVH
jgi:Ni,Fe-hydrogenase I large subunit